MNEDELVANLFRINQTKQKLLKDNIQVEKEAKDAHYEVGQKVRKAIADIGGMMPEDMPTPKKSLKELNITDIIRLNIDNNINYISVVSNNEIEIVKNEWK